MKSLFPKVTSVSRRGRNVIRYSLNTHSNIKESKSPIKRNEASFIFTRKNCTKSLIKEVNALQRNSHINGMIVINL